MKTTASMLVCTALLAAACERDVPPNEDEMPAPAPTATASPSRVAVAMSGAPADIGAGARITEFDAAGALVELRPGTNGWMCLADDSPAAPGDSPSCMDARWQDWFDAYAAGRPPRISGVGIAYMLQGSLSPSNTDPFIATPPAGESWMEDGPHLMVIVPEPAMLSGFPTDHSATGPYVMYAGTPYAHLMVPVAAHH